MEWYSDCDVDIDDNDAGLVSVKANVTIYLTPRMAKLIAAEMTESGSTRIDKDNRGPDVFLGWVLATLIYAHSKSSQNVENFFAECLLGAAKRAKDYFS